MSLPPFHLAFPVHDLEAARAFYGGLLGLPEVEKPGPMRASGGAWFAVGAQELHVGVEQDFTPAAKAHPALAVGEAELDAALASAA